MINEELDIRKNTSYSPKPNDTWIMDCPKNSHLGIQGWENHIWQNFSYTYNEDGFRTKFPYPDTDIIAVGDSFTEHHGGPEEEQWTQHVGKPVINLGMDGAGNDTIADIVEWGVNKFNPKTVLVMFSYLHRYNENGKFKADDTNHKRCQERMLFNFNRIVECTKGLNFIYSFIPDKLIIRGDNWADIDWLDNNFPKRLKIVTDKWDYGRDGHHFGPDAVRLIGYNFGRLV